MQEGDILLCYTDGLTEAFNKNREQFGLERVKHLIQINSGLSSKELQKLLYDELKLFTNHAPKEDDLTYIVVKKCKTEKNSNNFSQVPQGTAELSDLEPVDIPLAEDVEELEEL